LPRELRDVVVGAPYDKTLNGENFFLHDSGQDDEDRILIFGSDWAIKILTMCDVLFGDGTFKTVPPQFGQLFSVHGRFREYVFPFIFCLTVRLTQETYETVYQVIKNRVARQGRQLRPRMLMMDFELANINAASAAFPAAEVKCCLFHFTQSILRYVVNLGLRREYETLESDIRMEVMALMALPFVPLGDLEEVFQNITEHMDRRLDELITHLEDRYIFGPRRRNRRLAPRYPPTLWNVYDLVVAGFQRTNNAVEGWHNGLQKIMAVNHANIWRFLDNIKREEKEIRIQITQLLGGHTLLRDPLNKTYVTNQRQVEAIVSHYAQYKEEGHISEYLRGIAYHLKTRPVVEQEPPQDEVITVLTIFSSGQYVSCHPCA
jgi:hypothetical protein